VLLNPGLFTLKKKAPCLGRRGATYTVAVAGSDPEETVVVHNIHGDLKNQAETANYIVEHANAGAVVLGDVNFEDKTQCNLNATPFVREKPNLTLTNSATKTAHNVTLNTADMLVNNSRVICNKLPPDVSIQWRDQEGDHTGTVFSVTKLSERIYFIVGQFSGNCGEKNIKYDSNTNSASFYDSKTAQWKPVTAGMGKAMLDKASELIAAAGLTQDPLETLKNRLSAAIDSVSDSGKMGSSKADKQKILRGYIKPIPLTADNIKQFIVKLCEPRYTGLFWGKSYGYTRSATALWESIKNDDALKKALLTVCSMDANTSLKSQADFVKFAENCKPTQNASTLSPPGG
jgi:hypothetical protein